MRIAQIQAKAQIMQQRAFQFINEDADGQASQIADAMKVMQSSGVPTQ